MQRHPDGVTAVDTEYVRPGLAASHIIEHEGRAAFVDTGTTHSVPLLLAALDELGLARDAVDYVILTHVHLDHAGGAGRLMQALPQARAVLHPRGAPHMIDPSKLIAGSMAVYGEARYRELYGELVPIPSERVVTTQDGQRLSLAGRPLEFVHTPGHALHHQVIVDLEHRSLFTGDTFGLSYRELDTEQGAFIVPTTTPTQFDPEQLIASVDRLLGYAPQALYLTHYSRVTDVPRLAELLKLQIHEFVKIARSHRAEANRFNAISADMRALWLELLRRHGCTLTEARIDEVLGTDLELNTQGLIAWLDRERKG
ncbi:MBL fold metallo-hydrolase [Hyalangium minutum]|uniref:Beta-lactamase related protein n=1 Tax=Hyalangium minutum TaxID=394096 RepID=A0A085WSW2_9BACT|nr:MBL fold metallo-hydrolase [Hyalangium minutum]KFE70775.1 Beta-lactamase related protein [Hyalangium minutum]